MSWNNGGGNYGGGGGGYGGGRGGGYHGGYPGYPGFGRGGGYQNYRGGGGGGYNRHGDHPPPAHGGGAGYNAPPPPGFFPGPPPSHGYGGYQGFGGYGGGYGGPGYGGGWGDPDYGHQQHQGSAWAGGRKERSERSRSSESGHSKHKPEARDEKGAEQDEASALEENDKPQEREKRDSGPGQSDNDKQPAEAEGSADDSKQEKQSNLEHNDPLGLGNGEKVDKEETGTAAMVEPDSDDMNRTNDSDVTNDEPILERVSNERTPDKSKHKSGDDYDFENSLEDDQSPPPSFSSSLSSRRKQTTPTKKAVPPGESSTVLITHGGHLQAPDPDTPEKIPQEENSESDNTPSKILGSISSLRVVRKPRKKAEEIPKSPASVAPEEEKVALAPTSDAPVVVKKKRGRPFKKKPEGSDTESPSPKQRSPRKPRASTFAVPKDSPTLRKISGEEQDDSPQRRKSKGEMKAFPGPSEAAEKTPEQSKITGEDFDNVEAKLSVLHDDEGKESSFQDVKSAMEALYASDSADDENKKETALPEKKETATSEVPKKKRGRKPKSEKAKDEAIDSGKAKASESSAPAPGRERSKRASAQSATLKLQETSDEDEFYRRIDKKKDESTSSRKSIETEGESSQSKAQELTSTVPGLETSVERPKKLVKKSMRESLLSSIVSPSSSLNTEDVNTMTESDKESEEKKTDLILSMLKTIESPKKVKKKKAKEVSDLDQSSEEKKEGKPKRGRKSQDKSVQLKSETSPIEESPRLSEMETQNNGEEKSETQSSRRSRRSRTSEDSINQLLDSPASIPINVTEKEAEKTIELLPVNETKPEALSVQAFKQEATPVKTSKPEISPVKTPKPKHDSRDSSGKFKSLVKSSDQSPGVAVTPKKRGRKRKSDLNTPETGTLEANAKRKTSEALKEESKSLSPSIALPVTPLPIAEVSTDGKVEASSPLPENVDTLVKSIDPSALESNTTTTKKVEIKLKKVDIENKSPGKRGRKSLSSDNSKSPSEPEQKRASRRTRNTRSNEQPEPESPNKKNDDIVEVYDSKKSVMVDSANIDKIVEELDPFEKPIDKVHLPEKNTNDTVNMSQDPGSPKKRGRKPGSKNKAKSLKGPDENVDTNNKPTQSGKKKSKKMSKVEELLEKFKGPFVHIDGSFRSPNYVTIVNNANDSLKPSETKLVKFSCSFVVL